MNDLEKRKVYSLVSKLQDTEELGLEEREFLDTILTNDSNARKLYYELVDLEHQLKEDWTTSNSTHSTVPVGRNKFSIGLTLLKIAASLVVGSTLTYFYFFGYHPEGKTMITPTESVQNKAVGVLRYETGQLIFNEHTSPKDTDQLMEGRYQLKEGSLKLDFYAGATIQVDAPSEFEIISPIHINVSKGSLAVKVHDSRSLFKISSQQSAYIDLGTEFAINVNETGNSDLKVYDGEVLASSLGKTGNSERVKLVKSNETFHSNQSIAEQDNSIQPEFIKFEHLSLDPLDISHNYVNQILSSKPDAYWRLEGNLENEISGDESLTLQSIGSAIHFQENGANNHIELHESDQFNALKIDQKLRFSEDQNFTIELLACADRINRSTLFGLYDPSGVKENGETNHVALIDFMHVAMTFHHIPAAIRTAFRPVPSDDYYTGINMFTNTNYVPGRWVHIVLVKGSDYTATYLNGEQTSWVKLNPNDRLKAGNYAVIFGQMSIQDWKKAMPSQKRPFTGGIDEIAIYYRDLSKEEIKSHHESL